MPQTRPRYGKLAALNFELNHEIQDKSPRQIAKANRQGESLRKIAKMSTDPRSNRHYRTESDARRALVSACLQMNPLGINQGKSGNISLRWHRGGDDGYLITPSALPYEHMQPDDIIWLALDHDVDAAVTPASARVFPGTIPGASRGLRPSSEWRMHQMIYADVPANQASAVVHTHSSFATTLACLPVTRTVGIPAFHYMIAVAGGIDIRCAPYETFGTQALSDSARTALQGRRACLLANHGQLAYGDSLDNALALAVEVEALAKMYWQALQLGTPAILDDSQMQQVIEKFKHYRSPLDGAEP